MNVIRERGERATLTPDTGRAKRNKLLLIDGNSVLYRAFYGLPLLSNAKGLFTNAVYGFATMLLHLLSTERPTHIAVAFDKGKTTFRHDAFPDYKGKRQSTPPELIGQFAMARELLDSFRVPYVEMERYEADDIIGTLAERAGSEFEVLLVSGDKDLLQLVSPYVTACLTRKGTTDLVRYDPAAVKERFGLEPKQIVDLKGLMGDTSDNIPGVPGVGEKTAVKLLVEFGSVEDVLQHIDAVSGAKLQERLREHRELALLSKRLATIECDSPVPLTLDSLRYLGYSTEDVRRLFRTYEFRSLIARLPSDPADEEPAAAGGGGGPAETAGSQISLALEGESIRRLRLSDLAGEMATVGDSAALILDFAGDYQTGEWRGIALAHAGGSAYIGVSGADGDDPAHGGEDHLTPLWQLLESPSVQKVVYDLKAILVGLSARRSGAERGRTADGLRSAGTRAAILDTLLATYLIHASEGEPTLIDVLTKAAPEVQIPETVFAGLEGDDRSREDALVFCSKTLLATAVELNRQLVEMNLESLYRDVELPLAVTLADMEIYGVRVDAERLQMIGAELTQGIARLTEKIYKQAGVTFNINSTKQLGEILFDKMGLPAVKKTKTGYSTSADVLEKLAPYSEFVVDILEYRQLAKLQSTYVEGLLRVVREPDSRIHTSFRQAMTATGRLSSAEPNLQNIPIRLEEGRRLRQAFVPSMPEWQILSADYSQVELRILAHLSRDEGLTAAFRAEMDIHTSTASEVFEVPPEQVNALMRRQAKAVNFGIVYGISDYGLSQNLGISRTQAAEFIERYFAKFPGVRQYMRASVELARECGYAETLLGRKRYLPQIRGKNFNERSFAERTAMNTPIQGTAADIIKVAMVRIDAALREKELYSRMLLQVHDELIFEGPPNELEDLSNLVRHLMENAVQMDVPLKVDLHSGATWYDAK